MKKIKSIKLFILLTKGLCNQAGLNDISTGTVKLLNKDKIMISKSQFTLKLSAGLNTVPVNFYLKL